jgi:hypothetical protein
MALCEKSARTMTLLTCSDVTGSAGSYFTRADADVRHRRAVASAAPVGPPHGCSARLSDAAARGAQLSALKSLLHLASLGFEVI